MSEQQMSCSGDMDLSLGTVRMLPAMSPDGRANVVAIEKWVSGLDQVKPPMGHVVQAGMYARTPAVPAQTILAGGVLQEAVSSELEISGQMSCHGDMDLSLGTVRMLPATSPEALAKVVAIEKWVLGLDQVKLPTEHVIHAGMYARTLTMPAQTILTGSLMKRATLLILTGSALVLVGEEWIEFEGYNVIPGRAGRKQVCISRSQVIATMLFPTQARTVEDAEAEFTDEAAGLMSRWQDANTVVITGE